MVNVLLHLANTLLVWRLMLRLATPGAWLVAAVFAVHPAHVESVAWVIELKDVLSGLFYLSALLAWIDFAGLPRAGRYLTALPLYAAGTLAKSVVVTLPAALLIWQWWQRGRLTATDLLRTVPFFVVGGDDLGGGSGLQPVARRGGLRLLARRARAHRRACDLVLRGPILLAGRPVRHQRALAGTRRRSVGMDRAGGSRRGGRGALAAAPPDRARAAGRGAVLRRHTGADPGLVDYNYMLFSFTADRYQYLASIGIISVVIGAAAHGVAAVRRAGWERAAALSGLLAATLLGVLGTLTWRQAALYQDGITFFNHIIAQNPRARDAHLNFGNALLRWNRTEEALAAYRVTAELRAEDFKPPYGAGIALYHLGRPDDAESEYRHALRICPRYAAALARIGTLRLDQQRFAEALALSQSAVEFDPGNALAWINRGISLSRLGRTDDALDSPDLALAIDPHRRAALDARAMILREALLRAD